MQESVFFFLILILGACCLCRGVHQSSWERVVFGVVGLFGGVGRCFLS